MGGKGRGGEGKEGKGEGTNPPSPNPGSAAAQPYTNQSVFKSLLNCASEMSLSRNATGREFQRHGPATQKILSPRQ